MTRRVELAMPVSPSVRPFLRKLVRLVCGETDGQTDMARSTRLVMMIKNI